MSTHRRPTMPSSMSRMPAPAGQCRWCDKEILDRHGQPSRRLRWHPACVAIYRVACFSADQREAVYRRDKGICARCGKDAVADLKQAVLRPGDDEQTQIRRILRCGTGHLWQADHLMPLLESDGRIEYFLLSNLQTLCHSCHVAKGVEDRRRRKERA